MNEIFISYSSKEYDIAKELRNAFSLRGISCWMAPDSIPVGSNYAIEIPKAIQECNVFVIIISNNSQNSTWVRKEIDLAVNKGKCIVPIILDRCNIISPFDFYLTDVQMIPAAETPDKTAELVLRRNGITAAESTIYLSDSEKDKDVQSLKTDYKKTRDRHTSTTSSQEWECLSCNTLNSTISIQCSKCGRLKNQSVRRKEASNISTSASRIVSSDSKQWLCPNCGFSNQKIAVQCCQCGKLYWNNKQ